jgi:hypothetical protein
MKSGFLKMPGDILVKICLKGKDHRTLVNPVRLCYGAASLLTTPCFL